MNASYMKPHIRHTTQKKQYLLAYNQHPTLSRKLSITAGTFEFAHESYRSGRFGFVFIAMPAPMSLQPHMQTLAFNAFYHVNAVCAFLLLAMPGPQSRMCVPGLCYTAAQCNGLVPF